MSDLDGIPMAVVQRLRAEGAAAEREACAMLVLTIPIGTPNDTPLFCKIADAIRARGEPSSEGGAPAVDRMLLSDEKLHVDGPTRPTRPTRPAKSTRVAKPEGSAPCQFCGRLGCRGRTGDDYCPGTPEGSACSECGHSQDLHRPACVGDGNECLCACFKPEGSAPVVRTEGIVAGLPDG